MRVLRANKESLIAVLETIVYDPIINWRLVTSPDLSAFSTTKTKGEGMNQSLETYLPHADLMPEVLNKKAIQVIKRVNNKLTGRDFATDAPLNIAEQVQRLISQATSHENLCQCYIGWCPFW